MAHWIEETKTRKRFWAFAKENLTEDEVHAALGEKSVEDFAGTMAEAKALIEQAVETKAAQERAHEEARLTGTAATLPCAPMWAGTEFFSKAGYAWRYSYQVGLPSDLRALALEQVRDTVRDFEAMAKAEGWLIPGALNGAPARKLVAAETTEQAESEAGSDNGRQVLETEFIKVVAPKGTPRLEFWRPNRQYPEIFWALSIESFLEIAPSLAAAGWTVAKLEEVGSQYTAPLRIEWEPSPKNPKWKDIKAVTLR